MILRKYKNQLLTIIQELGFDPNLFIAQDKAIDKSKHFTISLRDTRICFAVQPCYGSFERFFFRYSEFSDGFPLCGNQLADDWNYLAKSFKSWLTAIVKPYLDDINTPDLWQVLQETLSHTKYESGTPADFESFSDEDKIRIRLSLSDFRLLIVNNFNPNKEELESIDSHIKYLSNAMDKHNKFDWKGIAINTVIAITTALSLNPEQGNQLFQLFKQVFSRILYFLPPA